MGFLNQALTGYTALQIHLNSKCLTGALKLTGKSLNLSQQLKG